MDLILVLFVQINPSNLGRIGLQNFSRPIRQSSKEDPRLTNIVVISRSLKFFWMNVD